MSNLPCQAKDPNTCRVHGNTITTSSAAPATSTRTSNQAKDKTKKTKKTISTVCPHGYSTVEHLNAQAVAAAKASDFDLYESIKNKMDSGDSECPHCSSVRRKARPKVVAGVNDLATVQPLIAAEWDKEGNKSLTPQMVLPQSSKRVKWICSSCKHAWEEKITNRNTGYDCPNCPSKPLTKENSLAVVNPDLAAEWHPTKNGVVTPDDVKARARRYAYWLGSCGHEWKAIIADRNAGNPCPYCYGRKFQPGFNDLLTANPDLAAEWHSDNMKEGGIGLTASEVIGNDPRKVLWLGECGHKWVASIASRMEGSGCRRCSKSVSKAEREIVEVLEQLGLEVEGSNREFLGRKEIDIYIASHKLGIEFNGIHWHKESRKKDINAHHYKWDTLKAQGIDLVQIWEDDYIKTPALVLKTLARRVKGETRPTSKTFSVLSSSQAETYLESNHLHGHIAGDTYIGGMDANGKLQSVMVLRTDNNGTAEIVRYCSDNGGKDLKGLLTTATEAHKLSNFTVLTDNCEGEGQYYTANGFTESSTEAPNYMHVIKGKRFSPTDYPADRFRTDPNLLWREGLNEMELGELNGWDRIWDAGKTRYNFSV